MVSFGSRRIGPDEPCFVTFEAGPTHSGLASAKRLVEHAAAAKADAVKFQIVDPDRLVADRKQLFTYDVLVDRATGETETVSESLYDILCRRSLTPDEWNDLMRYCSSLGLVFFATVTSEEELAMVERFGCQSVKIASADVNFHSFVRRAARNGMCLQLDTGNATIGEIEAAVDAIRAEGNENIIIHHCPTGYPARLEGINLRVIQTLKQIFPYPVGFSDHSPGWEMDVAAVALGADLVEKTITEDRSARSVEHVMSIEPPEMKAFVQLMHDLKVAFGKPRRIMSEAEQSNRIAVRRSAHLVKDAKPGTPVEALEVAFRRPGFGISPELWPTLAGMKLRSELPAGHRLAVTDLTG